MLDIKGKSGGGEKETGDDYDAVEEREMSMFGVNERSAPADTVAVDGLAAVPITCDTTITDLESARDDREEFDQASVGLTLNPYPLTLT